MRLGVKIRLGTHATWWIRRNVVEVQQHTNLSARLVGMGK
jgi:hypothetical protein